MKRTLRGLACAAWCVLAAPCASGAAPALGPSPPAAGRLPSIAANDNTRGAGALAKGVLHIDLVARRGTWHPDGPGTLGLPIEAFGETGKPLQIPGPFVRVPLGTRVLASVRNELGRPLTVRGLAAPADALTAELVVPRGATRRVAFTLDRAGAFGYYGSDRGEVVGDRFFADAELSGAIVVDAPHAPRVDHAFVLGLYAPVKTATGDPNFLYFLETINGRSFPATERLAYVRGRHVRWAVFNGSAMIHPMHLHGFYFRLDRPDAYDEVTHAFAPGDAAELAWTADRAGSWMFHCHISDHISRHAPLEKMLAGKADRDYGVPARFHLPDRPMGGMVIAVRVLPRLEERAVALAPAPRRLALSIDARAMPNAPYAGFVKETVSLHDGASTSTTTGNLGPAIVLTRGVPVAIAVHNHLAESTSIHWHGVALADSYYDGGAGMGMPMDGERMSPPIAPGASFVARFTPPDAGTFMYHAHMDDGWQQASGLEGPLIVLAPGERFDPETDHVVMLSDSFEKAGSPLVAIDGELSPPPLEMTAGVPQRLRFAVLSLGGDNLVASLSDGSHVLRWTPVAKDGRTLPARLQRERAASQSLTIGETRDFRFVPVAAGSLQLSVFDGDNGGMLVGRQPVIVTPGAGPR